MRDDRLSERTDLLHPKGDGPQSEDPAASAALYIAVLLLIGLGLMHFGALYGPAHI